MIGDENNSGVYYLAIFSIVIIGFSFITLMIDYFSTYTIKDTADAEFKRIVVNEMAKKLTDEYSSDYMAKFENSDKTALEEVIKKEFVSKMKSEKGYDINISLLEIQQPSDLTITCSLKGTCTFTPMIAKNFGSAFIFKLPIESKAKVIRFDEY